MEDVLKQMKADSLAALEALVVKWCDSVLPAALDEAKKAIPGQVDDIIIETLKAPLVAEAKKFAGKIYAEPAG
jgi:hypothetical protein